MLRKLTFFLISFSLVLWEIINHKIPYHDINPEDVKTHVLNGKHPQPEKTNGTPVEYQEIMEKGWNLSPTRRPNIRDMLDVLKELEEKEKTWSEIPRIGDNSNDAPTINAESNPADEVRLQYIFELLIN